MTVYAPQADKKPGRSGDCGCGCGGACGCESRCCDLDCLVRPRFFCGQVLTDTDLGATVDWARNRFSLARYRHGWGVVCGLDVSCTRPGGHDDCCPDPQTGPTVYVDPGYAIDCCGNDLVVCQPIAVNLGDACRPPEDPCNPTSRSKSTGGQKQAEVYKGGKEPEPHKGPEKEGTDCWSSLRHGLFGVTLRLRYHESLANGQSAMFRSGCCDVAPCEYSRVLEQPCVYVEECPSGCDEGREWRSWQEDYDAGRQQAKSEIRIAIESGIDGTLKYLRRHPPYKFCFLHDLVCCFRDREEHQRASPRDESSFQKLRQDDWGSRVYFWLYLDWYLRQFQCACWSCKPDQGVPIARVLMQRLRHRPEDVCRVVMIDTSVPHRRLLHKDPCRPIPRCAVDLAPYLWQPVDLVAERLATAGVMLAASSSLAETFDSTEQIHGRDLWVDVSQQRSIQPLVVKDPFNCERIIGFGTP